MKREQRSKRCYEYLYLKEYKTSRVSFVGFIL